MTGKEESTPLSSCEGTKRLCVKCWLERTLYPSGTGSNSVVLDGTYVSLQIYSRLYPVPPEHHPIL